MPIISNCKMCGKEIVKRGIKTKPGKFCSKDCESAWKRRQRSTKEWMHQKYIEEHLTTSDIAEIVEKDPKTVWQWLQDYEIPTRGRGYGQPDNWFKPGHKNEYRKYDQAFRAKMREVRLQDGRVPYLKDGEPYMKGRTGKQHPGWKGGCTPERQKAYSSQEWSDCVRTVWERDNATCQRCGLDYRTIDREEYSFHIHHIISFANEETRFNIDNLVLLCEDCHRFVHSNENEKGEFLDG